ncbi:hypothetical protein Lalb_Chr04g0263911 [Lupinus albus]|uniref:Uncharacterized protein n=1 Tax=Lupinus albus TaxID=3870 RepID=A0A6A4QRS4_LUPAL|nr:hypothetical protein Lalb_Chr04g0263911 [Lupinus albus]
MENRVHCPENQELASYMWNKWKEMAEKPKGISDNIEMALSKAHLNVCNSKNPILTIKHFSQVKYVLNFPYIILLFNLLKLCKIFIFQIFRYPFRTSKA